MPVSSVTIADRPDASMRSFIVFSAVLGMALALTNVDVHNIQQLEAARRTPGPKIVTLHNIQVPAGQTLDIQGFNGSKIVFAGRITWGYKEWDGPMLIIKGSNMQVEGRPGHVLDGEGQRWWDGLGARPGGRRKPTMIYLQLENSDLNTLKVLNSPAWCMAINSCFNTRIGNVEIDNSLGHTKGGHNTDGFDVGNSRNVTIYNSKVNNQDDCLAINSGSDITFEGNICEGGHGIAVAVGGYNNNQASNIIIRRCQVIKNNIGIRVKTSTGTGLVNGVTFDDIVLKDISEMGIVIIGNYVGGGPQGEPNPKLPIHNLRINNVRGNVLQNGTNSWVYVAPGTPQGWSWNANVQGGKQKKQCKGVPGNIRDPCA